MCGLVGLAGPGFDPRDLQAMVGAQTHRGPDAVGTYAAPEGIAGLGHNRLSIIDLSAAGRQPMSSADGRYWLVFNGEVYNYLELRAELADYPFRSRADSEVVLAAFDRWGPGCLDRFVGMFALLIWDTRSRSLFAARDRFGVKPLHYHVAGDGTLKIASEIKALHRAGVPAVPDEPTWATYFARGASVDLERTFWEGVRSLPAGHWLTWQDGRIRTGGWYDIASRVGIDYDERPLDVVEDEYLALLTDSVRLRFRSDVPVGVNLSGGLDSSTLLGLVQAVQGESSDVQAFTFVTGDPNYDELPWVRRMLERTHHPSVVCPLDAAEVPELARSVQTHQDEPFGGIPTLAYARLFEIARDHGVTVLLDGQGMDEQWAGYDYYQDSAEAQEALLQGARSRSVRPECLTSEFRRLAVPFEPARPFPDRLRNLQYRDLRYSKIPRALRFSDRVSMRCSRELREPFLDHRLVELALRQRPDRKISNGSGKWLLRRITSRLLPKGIFEAPKRPVQTPQREWLRGELREWATERVGAAVSSRGGSWLDGPAVLAAWRDYLSGQSDNSFAEWQWINLGLMTGDSSEALPARRDDGVMAS